MSGTTFSKLPVMIVALVIGLILTFTAVMPLVSDYSKARTITNDGYFCMSYVEDTDVSLTWDRSAPNTLTINSDPVDISKLPNDRWLSVMCADSFTIRLQKTNEGVSISIQAFGTFNGLGAGTSGSRSTLSATCSAGTISVSDGTATRTGTYTSGIYYIDPEGSFSMKDANKTAYMYGDSVIFATGNTNFTGVTGDFVYNLSGTIDDGVTVTAVNVPLGTTNGDVTVSKSDNSKFIDMFDLSTLTFNVTPSGGTAQTVTYSYYIVPYELNATPDNPTAYKNLVSVLPLFALILLVAGAASLVYFKNKD